jgi:aspartate kinase
LENVVPDLEGFDGENDDETLDQAFYDNVAFALRDRIEQCGSRVPVVTGLCFFNQMVLNQILTI